MSTLRHFSHRTPWFSVIAAAFLTALISSAGAEPVVTSPNAAETEKLLAPAASPLTAAIGLFKAKKYPEAKTALAALVAAEPKNAEALFYLGCTAFETDDLPEAVRLLEKATAADGSQSRYFQLLGDAYGRSAQRASVFGKMGWAKKCLAAYDKSVALDPDNLGAREQRIQFYRHAPGFIGGGMGKAYADAEEIRQRDPIRGLLLYCDLSIQEKKVNEAFDRLEKLIVEEPETKGYLYVLGTLSAMSGQRLDRGAEALTSYLAHLPKRKAPAHHWTHLRLGILHEKKGDKAAARAEYEAALALKADFSPAQQSLKNLK